MLEWLKTNATAARDKLSTEVSKFKNREFMAAATSAHPETTASMNSRFLNLLTSAESLSRAAVALVFSHSSIGFTLSEIE